MDAIIDKFGKDVIVLANDMKSFRAVVTTATGPVFFSWVFGFGSHVSIKAPEDVKGEYARLVLEAAEAIKENPIKQLISLELFIAQKQISFEIINNSALEVQYGYS